MNGGQVVPEDGTPEKSEFSRVNEFLARLRLRLAAAVLPSAIGALAVSAIKDRAFMLVNCRPKLAQTAC